MARCWMLLAAACLGAMTGVSPAFAQAAPAANADARDDAARHFRRGVELFKDADFNGALAEFRRAQQIAPNPRVLYNMGQTYYELQRYPDALKALEEYLAAVGDELPKERRAAVAADVERLRGRVAKLEIRVDVDGSQIRVDDEIVGTSPLAAPLVVSVGRHRVGASHEGRTEQSKTIEVVGGDTLPVVLQLPLVPVARVEPSATPGILAVPPAADQAPPPPSRTPMWIGWSVTGVLVLATATTGLLTLSAKSDLKTELATYPGDPAAIEASRDKGKTLAIATDVLGASAIIAAGVSTYLTWKVLGDEKRTTGAVAPRWGVGFAPTGAYASGTF